MSKNKSLISKIQDYEELDESWDTHTPSDWDEAEPVEFEIDILGEEIHYAIDKILLREIHRIARDRNISAVILINLWLQEELQKEQVKPDDSEFYISSQMRYYPIDIVLSDRIRAIAREWEISANDLVNLWLKRKTQMYQPEAIRTPSRQYPVDAELSGKISELARKRGISANIFVNLLLQRELQKEPEEVTHSKT